MHTQQVITPPVLPPVIPKGDVALYFGCHMTTVWRKYLTRELLSEWGYDYDDDIKWLKLLPYKLTQRIFKHWNIEPLAWYSIVKPHLTESIAA